MVADGSGILKDAEYAAQDFTSALTGLNGIWKKFANGNLAKPVQELADALNSVDQETVQRWLEIGKDITIAVGGIIAARKAFQLGKGAMDLFGVGKGKGIPTGVADVFGSGVMPVYVTNMPANGLGKGGSDLPTLPEKNTSPGKSLLPTAINTASEITSLIPFPETKEDKQQLIQRVQENANRPSMWNDIKDWFISANNAPEIANPQPWASLQPQNQTPAYPSVPPQLKGEIRVVIEGDARVKSVKMDQPGVTLSAQSGVSNVEQS